MHRLLPTLRILTASVATSVSKFVTTSVTTALKTSFGLPHAIWPLVCLLLVTLCWIPLGRWLLGAVPAALFVYTLRFEPPERRLRYLALAYAVAVLALAPINTNTRPQHFVSLGTAFLLAIAIPTTLLWARTPRVVTFKFWPDRLDWVDVLYTLSAVPLAWLAFKLYFGVLSLEVPFNWTLPAEPNSGALFRLFIGINGVGIWDELFFINVSYAIIRSLFPYKVANPAQAVIYTSVLYSMAFRGLGFFLVYLFALTQGAMYERSKALLWVLVVHLIVDYFLFQAIITAYYPDLDVWWHP